MLAARRDPPQPSARPPLASARTRARAGRTERSPPGPVVKRRPSLLAWAQHPHGPDRARRPGGPVYIQLRDGGGFESSVVMRGRRFGQVLQCPSLQAARTLGARTTGPPNTGPILWVRPFGPAGRPAGCPSSSGLRQIRAWPGPSGPVQFGSAGDAAPPARGVPPGELENAPASDSQVCERTRALSALPMRPPVEAARRLGGPGRPGETRKVLGPGRP